MSLLLERLLNTSGAADWTSAATVVLQGRPFPYSDNLLGQG